jgi:hypothetical protein
VCRGIPSCPWDTCGSGSGRVLVGFLWARQRSPAARRAVTSHVGRNAVVGAADKRGRCGSAGDILRAAARPRAPAAHRLGDRTGSSVLSAQATTASATATAEGRSDAATPTTQMTSSAVCTLTTLAVTVDAARHQIQRPYHHKPAILLAQPPPLAYSQVS